jgi:hypothetical protein
MENRGMKNIKILLEWVFDEYRENIGNNSACSVFLR